MNLIDARKKFVNKHLVNFVDNKAEDVLVDIFIEKSSCAMSYPIGALKDFFTNQDSIELITDDDDVITFKTDDTELKFAGSDFKWYLKTEARLNKLFGLETKKSESKPKTSSKEQYTIYIGTKQNDNIVDIQQFVGNKNQTLEFINKEYAKREIRSFFSNLTVFSLDNQSWYSFDEFVSQGAFVL